MLRINMILTTCFELIQAAVLAPSSKTEKKVRAVCDKLSNGTNRYISSFAIRDSPFLFIRSCKLRLRLDLD